MYAPSPRLHRVAPSLMVSLALVILLTLSSLLAQRPFALQALPATVAPPMVMPDYGHLPLSFVPNVGQTDPSVRFQARGMGGTLFFTRGEVVLSLPTAPETSTSSSATNDPREHLGYVDFQTQAQALAPSTVVRLSFEGANANPDVSGTERLPGTVNYFHGNDTAKWRANVPSYGGIVYKELFPGIDLYYDGPEGQLKGTYIVAPGVNPNVIRWRYQGTSEVHVDDGGNLLIALSGSAHGQTLTERAPIGWQEIDGQRVSVEVKYAVAEDGSIGFLVGGYDPDYMLTLDPTLTYSTFIGGGFYTDIYGLGLDGDENVYVVGITRSPDFPTTDNVVHPVAQGRGDAFVMKVSSDGTSILYSTFLGGSQDDGAFGLKVDDEGNAYITGTVASPDFPVTRGVYRQSCTADHLNRCSDGDSFVAKLNPSGTALLYSTYFGASGAREIEVGADSTVYIAGTTNSTSLPTSEDAMQRDLNRVSAGNSYAYDGFIARLDATGSNLIYSTYLGGSGNDHANGLAVDHKGNAYITGETVSPDFPLLHPVDGVHDGFSDAFIAKLNANGSQLVYSTYLGGSRQDQGRSIAVDRLEQAYIVGNTNSPDYPIAHPVQSSLSDDMYNDILITRLDAAGSSINFSTYLGGYGDDLAWSLALGRTGNVYVAGNNYVPGDSHPTSFPTVNPIQPRSHGSSDVIVAAVDLDKRSLLFSTYLGGTQDEVAWRVAVGSDSSIYVAGLTRSSNFPTANSLMGPGNINGYGGTGFLSKISNLNQSPSVDAGSPYEIAEGSSVNVSAIGSDPNGDALAYMWDLDNDGNFETPGQTITFLAEDLDGPSTLTIRVQVTDSGGLSATDQAIVNVQNVAPTVGAITAPLDPVQVNTMVTTAAKFADPGILDTHTASWDWGDGSISPGVVVEKSGRGQVMGSHAYANAGVYPIQLTVTDKDDGQGTVSYLYVVVYDQAAGFVTGGGWFTSPTGACKLTLQCSAATGKASFGFVSRYKPGKTIPDGNTEFDFKAGTLQFSSTNYEWLVVAGARSQYKGTGTINGKGSYGFLLTALDGHLNGGGGADKLRVKIWVKASGSVVYDNQMDTEDSAQPSTIIGGGNIVIHK